MDCNIEGFLNDVYTTVTSEVFAYLLKENNTIKIAEMFALQGEVSAILVKTWINTYMIGKNNTKRYDCLKINYYLCHALLL